MKQKIEEETNQVFIRADNMILIEEVDIQWSGFAEAELTSKFESSELSNIEVVNIECRSTLCKMNVNVISPISQLDTYEKLYLSMSWDGTAAVQIDPNGSSALIYISREGYDLTDKFQNQTNRHSLSIVKGEPPQFN